MVGRGKPLPYSHTSGRCIQIVNDRLCEGEIKLFQRSFYDHVIRNESDYQEIWTYIDQNPAKWSEDRFYRD